jgi:glutathione peroxidase
MTIYDFQLNNRAGEPVSLEQFKGKVLLVVNTATKCGLTPQYTGLVELYERFQARGFEILDFPCNQFKEQAPESDEEIHQFCTLNYQTQFPRFAKIDVNGANANPLFVWLKRAKPKSKGNLKAKAFEAMVKPLTKGNQPEDIKWNFEKFLIDRAGNVVERFSPACEPADMIKDIERVCTSR